LWIECENVTFARNFVPEALENPDMIGIRTAVQSAWKLTKGIGTAIADELTPRNPFEHEKEYHSAAEVDRDLQALNEQESSVRLDSYSSQVIDTRRKQLVKIRETLLEQTRGEVAGPPKSPK
jgi:hypothetical protein